MESLLEYIEKSREEAERVGSSVRDFRVFDFSFIPDKPLVRPETKRIIDCLVRYQQTGIPRNMVIVGPRGCGKTLTFRYLAKALKEKLGLAFHGVNCRINSTSYKILASILKIRPRGVAYSELCERFEQTVPGPTVIVLDESDMLCEKDVRKDVLYFLSRSRRQYSVVLLSNNPRYLRNLDESTRSSLQPEYIHFNSYSAQEILDILKDRAETGLKAVDEGMLGEIAAMTARNSSGDARIAIKSLLYCATKEADSVQACFDKAREDVMADVLSNTNEKSLLILKAALQEPTRLVKAVYQHYVALCRQYREEPYGYTQYYAAIGFMASLGLLALVSAKVDRTYSNRIELLVTGEQIDAAIAKRFH